MMIVAERQRIFFERGRTEESVNEFMWARVIVGNFKDNLNV